MTPLCDVILTSDIILTPPRSAMKTKEGRMAMDLSITFRNRRVSITIFLGTFVSDDPDKYVITFWEFKGHVLLEYYYYGMED